jgi:hypothetical protein
VVRVNQLPTATVTGTTAVCQNATPPSITFTGANGSAPYTFTYRINSGATLTLITPAGSSSATVTAQTGMAGTYAYTLISVRDANSTACEQGQTSAALVTVNPLPTITNNPSLTLCSRNNTSLRLTASVPSTYSWTLGSVTGGITGASAGNGDSIRNILVNPGNATAGTVEYRVTPRSTPQNCVGPTFSILATVNPLPVAPAITGPTGPLCQFTLNQLFSANSPSPAVQYAWSATGASINAQTAATTVPATGTPGGQNAIVSFRNSGAATIAVRATYTATGCVSDSTPRTITVTTGTAADTAKVVYNGTDFIALNNTVTKYQWGYDSVNLAPVTIAGETFQNYSRPGAMSETAKFAFWVRTEKGSCQTKNYFNTPPSYSFRIGQAPPRVEAQPVSVQPIRIFPNPTRERLTIAWNSSLKPQQCVVTDILGRRIVDRKLTPDASGSTSLDVSGLQEGIYFIQLLRNGEKAAIARFVKE